MKRIIYFTALCLSTACSAQTVRVADVLATGNITTSSQGTFTDGTTIRQSNSGSAGGATGYELWKGANGFIGEASYTPTNSSLWSTNGKQICTWPIDRYKIDLLYERSLHSVGRLHPYAGAGAFVSVFWGGNAPAHSGVLASGFDATPGAVLTIGSNTRLISRLYLKTGVLVDLAKASTYGDQTYRASRNYQFEPQVGLAWRLGRAGRHL